MRPFHYASILFIASVFAWAGYCYVTRASWWLLLIPVLIYIHLLVFGAINIRWNFFVKSLHRHPAKRKEIALTFDDGPAKMTQQILDLLAAEGVQATFFSIGKHAKARPDTVQRWEKEGHAIGNHSYEHGFNFDWKSAAAMKAEIDETNTVIESITGKRPLLFRPPYGVTNPNLAKAIRKSGMYSIGWNIRSFDTKAKNPEQLLNRILSRLQGGDIILLHDSMAITTQILTPLIHAARQKGFTFVRVDQLLEIEAYA